MSIHNATQQILDKIDELSKRIDKVEEQQKRHYNDNMNRFDQVMGELEAIREEKIIGTYQVRELREGHADHEKRISILEKSV